MNQSLYGLDQGSQTNLKRRFDAVNFPSKNSCLKYLQQQKIGNIYINSVEHRQDFGTQFQPYIVCAVNSTMFASTVG